MLDRAHDYMHAIPYYDKTYYEIANNQDKRQQGLGRINEDNEDTDS